MPVRAALAALLPVGPALLAALPALADSHGNALVHSRSFNAITYMMYRDHMTLYTYGEDQPLRSACSGECAERWPPATLPEGSELGENYSLFLRQDGRWQIAYKGRPLYLYSGDTRPGDITGDGLDGVWALARPTP